MTQRGFFSKSHVVRVGATLAVASAAFVGFASSSAHAAIGTAAIRLAGADRYGTAVAVARDGFPYPGAAGTVVLARGTAFPDALVGVAIAAAVHAPLLLTDGASLQPTTAAEISTVLVPGGTVDILGGPSSVPSQVEAGLRSNGYQVHRYSGSDRYSTAIAIADALGDPEKVLLADGTNFPDALAAGPAAHHIGGVVLLTAGPTLPAATKAYLAAHPAATVYAVGGPAAAADPVATPIVGTDRYDTALRVAATFFDPPSSVGIATGNDFPDALAGGAQQANVGGALLLSTPASLPDAVSIYLISHAADIRQARLFGGTSTLSQHVESSVDNRINGFIDDSQGPVPPPDLSVPPPPYAAPWITPSDVACSQPSPGDYVASVRLVLSGGAFDFFQLPPPPGAALAVDWHWHGEARVWDTSQESNAPFTSMTIEVPIGPPGASAPTPVPVTLSVSCF